MARDQRTSPAISEECHQVREMCRDRAQIRGVYSLIAMKSAGFQYTNNGDAARCDTCGLEVSGWTSDMKPFTIHKQRSPTCSFVLKMLPPATIITSPTTNTSQSISTLNDNDRPSSLQNNTPINETHYLNTLLEVERLKQIRKRTFSHWPHRSSPSSSQMIEAGFFNCNVEDRVICIYCNIICQHWTPNSDDPCEVHKTLSPKCPYVIAMLTCSQTSPTLHLQKNSSNSDSRQMILNLNETAINKNFAEPKKRHESFTSCPSENLPPVDDLVKAGFFYTSDKKIVKCFYCNGILQNWGPYDNPIVKHVRCFPHCAYARQLCDAELYRKIQDSKSAERGIVSANNSRNVTETSSNNSSSKRLLIPDQDTLSRLVAVRLNLPISQSLLDRNFKPAIIRRCWEDQLRLKHEDFVTDCDLLMACKILQKQIEHIDGKEENVIVPSVAMKKIRDQERTEYVLPEIEIQNASPTDLCVLCLTEKKRLACIPCGHLATCVPCGHTLRSCPICRREIEAFVRIYI